MKMIEQLKDEYGNLIQLWGVYEETDKTILKEGLAFPVKKDNKKLIRTFPSLLAANYYLNNVLDHKIGL